MIEIVLGIIIAFLIIVFLMELDSDTLKTLSFVVVAGCIVWFLWQLF